MDTHRGDMMPRTRADRTRVGAGRARRTHAVPAGQAAPPRLLTPFSQAQLGTPVDSTAAGTGACRSAAVRGTQPRRDIRQRPRARRRAGAQALL